MGTNLSMVPSPVAVAAQASAKIRKTNRSWLQDVSAQEVAAHGARRLVTAMLNFLYDAPADPKGLSAAKGDEFIAYWTQDGVPLLITVANVPREVLRLAASWLNEAGWNAHLEVGGNQMYLVIPDAPAYRDLYEWAGENARFIAQNRAAAR